MKCFNFGRSPMHSALVKELGKLPNLYGSVINHNLLFSLNQPICQVILGMLEPSINDPSCLIGGLCMDYDDRVWVSFH